MRHREDEEFEEIARATRRKLGIEHQLQPDMVTVLFKLQQLGMITSYERVPDGQMPVDLGAFDPDSRIMHLRDSTFVAANDVIGQNPGRQRARFTIAHELGHVVLVHHWLFSHLGCGSTIARPHCIATTAELVGRMSAA